MINFPNIKVMNYRQALAYAYDYSGDPKYPKYAIISIQEPTHGYGLGLAFQKGGNCLAALNIRFSDCTPVIQLKDSRLMSGEQAKKIHDFVETIPANVEVLIIHCRKGKSRSVAVASAISLVKTGSYEKVINMNNEKIINDESSITNKYVYCMMLEAYGRQNKYQEKYAEEDKMLLEQLLNSYPENITPEIIHISKHIIAQAKAQYMEQEMSQKTDSEE